MIDTVEECGRPALKVTVLSVLVAAELALPAASPPRPGPSQRSLVLAAPVTATVQVGVNPETAATSGPPTVLGAKLTSAPANPDTVSPNTTVKLIGLALRIHLIGRLIDRRARRRLIDRVGLTCREAAIPQPGAYR